LKRGLFVRVTFGSPNINSHELRVAIDGVLGSGWVSIGEYVEALEAFFRSACGVRYAIGCNSATQGLVIALKAAGWGSGGYRVSVNMPAFTWPSTLYAVDCIGGEPIFHDIDPGTWLMEEPNHNHGKLLLVDTFGNMAKNFDGFAKEDTIVDAAHGFGLPFLGQRGIAEVVSLSFTKVVTGMEGGMILTDDHELASTAIELRRLTARMGEINALVALQSIKNYDPAKTRAVVNHYKKHITVPFEVQDAPDCANNSVFSLRFERTVTRDAIRIALERAGVETKVYHDPLDRGHPETENLYSTILSIPTHHEVYDIQDEIIEIINTAGRTKTPGLEYLSR
jgi:dTDP-4-amino-4,6-dideoxygalactose transaminase